MNTVMKPITFLTKEQIKLILTKSKNYGYIVVEDKKIALEIDNLAMGEQYAKAFGKKFYDHLPYAEYGYEDPFNFANEWGVCTISDQDLKYEVLDGKIYESLVPIGGVYD